MIEDIDVREWKKQVYAGLHQVQIPSDLIHPILGYLMECTRDDSLLCFSCELFVSSSSVRLCQHPRCDKTRLHLPCLDACVVCESVVPFLCEDHDRLYHCEGPVCAECLDWYRRCEECGYICCRVSCEKCGSDGCAHCGWNHRQCGQCYQTHCDGCGRSCDNCDRMSCCCTCKMDETD